MKTNEPNKPNRVAEEWGTWKQAENSSHQAFKNRSPVDRLAWLEDILRLRANVLDSEIQQSL